VFGQNHWDTGVLDLNRIWRGDDLMTPEQKRAVDWLVKRLNQTDDLMTPEQKRAVDWLVKQLNQTEVSSWAKPSWDKAVDVGVIRHNNPPGEPVSVERMVTFLDRAGALDKFPGGQLTADQIQAIQDGAVVAVGKKLVG